MIFLFCWSGLIKNQEIFDKHQLCFFHAAYDNKNGYLLRVNKAAHELLLENEMYKKSCAWAFLLIEVSSFEEMNEVCKSRSL